MTSNKCSVGRCGKTLLARSMCSMHYQRFMRHGSIAERRRGTEIGIRFWVKINRTRTCWLWSGSKDRKGYGRIEVRGKPVLAHRVAWLLSVGEIPGGMCVLHRCDEPSCVRPDHLFIGSIADNNKDMAAKGRTRHRPLFCRRGHPLRGDNLYTAPGSDVRHCRTCRRDALRSSRARRKKLYSPDEAFFPEWSFNRGRG